MYALEDPKLFIARGGFTMQEVRIRPLLLLALDEVAYVSEALTKQLRDLNFNVSRLVEDSYPLLPPGQAPVGMPAEVRFAKFVAGFLATLEYSMVGVQAVCKNQVRILREEMEQLRKTVEVYRRRYYKTLLDHENKVIEVLLTAMNGRLKSAMIDLAEQEGILHRIYR